MATYYPTSSAQMDVVLSAPYPKDQKFASYSESPLNMMMYLNPVSSTTESFSEIPPNSSMNPQHNVEIPCRNEMMFIPPTSDPMCMQTINDGSLSIGGGGGGGGNHVDQNLQGLSLSLSTQMSTAVSSASPLQYHQYSNPDYITSSYDMHGDGNNNNMVRMEGSNNHNHQYVMNPKAMDCSNSYQYEQAGIAATSLKSKYLKAAQQLLDEVVNVRDALKQSEFDKGKNTNKVDEGSKESRDGSQPGSETNESAAGSGSTHELSPTERHDLQGKLEKLQSMLDEIDRRYRQYCQQMQILVASFDVVAGGGAAKPYTALALKTISRHFRCLRDAITGQIQATRKSLGEQDNGLGAIPRLRYVDQQLRQQRALQQFGMIRHAWRPQRGLPEGAVTVLRAWLFEHFLHPYPKDSEKTMLARQTGLTRSQVANWFINARVRLWKPMVEDMYKEEFGDVDINSRSSPEKTPNFGRERSWGSEDPRQETQAESATSNKICSNNNHDIMETTTNRRPTSSFSTSVVGLQMGGAFGSSNDHNNNHGFYNSNIPSAAYHLPNLGNFSVNNNNNNSNNNNNNQVSLALGLHHCEGEVVQLSSGTNFEGNGNEETAMGVGTSEYPPYVEQVNQQHRFGNPHILNDFVA